MRFDRRLLRRLLGLTRAGDTRSFLSFEPLESRLLLSADPLAGATVLDGFDGAGLQADYQIFDESILARQLDEAIESELQFTGLAAEPLPELSATAGSVNRRELIFVDTSVDDYQHLLQDIGQPGEHTSYQIILLQADRDGVQQMSAALAGQQGIDAIHLVSHGSAGNLQLGNSLLHSGSLAHYQAELVGWRAALSVDADLLIYSCDVAAGFAGEDFLDSIAGLVGVDVAASDDLTGAPALGADWELEYQSGTVETASAFPQDAPLLWQGMLALNAYESFSYGAGTLEGDAGGSGWATPWAPTTARMTAGPTRP